jgi:hypothetical protein
LPSDGIVMGEDYLDTSQSAVDTTRGMIIDSEVSSDSSDSASTKAALPASKDITSYEPSFGKQIQYVAAILKLPSSVVIAALSIIGILCTAFIIYMLRGFQPQKD